MVVKRPLLLATTFNPRFTSTGMLPLFLTRPTTVSLPSEPVNGGCVITLIGLSLCAYCTVTRPQEIQIVKASAMIDWALKLGKAIYASVVCALILICSSSKVGL